MDRHSITACLLAGGRGERLGGIDKGLIWCGDKRLVEHCIERLQPQVSEIIISANRNLGDYEGLASMVVADGYGDYAGPLAGLLSVMRHSTREFVLMSACDSPFIPKTLATRLGAALEQTGSDVAVASDGEHLQPVFAVIRCALADDLAHFLEAGGRKIMAWYEAHPHVVVEFDEPDIFMNINTAADLDMARLRLASHA